MYSVPFTLKCIQAAFMIHLNCILGKKPLRNDFSHLPKMRRVTYARDFPPVSVSTI